MKPEKIENLFTDEELEIINNSISKAPYRVDGDLGRLMFEEIRPRGDQLNRDEFVFLFNDWRKLESKLIEIGSSICGTRLSFKNAMCVEYNSKYGQPNLPAHFDGDTCDMIINFQLSSNTRWHIGLDMEAYDLQDNSAVIFNGNKSIHWRPVKEFKEGEFVKMIFFRLADDTNPSNYSHMALSQTDMIFYEVNKFRDSVSNYYK